MEFIDTETPPRTWRRRGIKAAGRLASGNTSTDVEKTPSRLPLTIGVEKHLHGRGEDCMNASLTAMTLETPPRTWRRLRDENLQDSFNRNTSTDVEKTARFSVRLIQPTLLFVVMVVKGGSLTN